MWLQRLFPLIASLINRHPARPPGGCYAKCIDLSPETEPEIFAAIQYGSILENVVYDPYTRVVDYHDTSITLNTRCAYPIDYIPNAKVPSEATHPSNVILLTCDAFGVMPPVAKLTHDQAMYHFVAGYTAKVAGTEVGVTEPKVLSCRWLALNDACCCFLCRR